MPSGNAACPGKDRSVKSPGSRRGRSRSENKKEKFAVYRREDTFPSAEGRKKRGDECRDPKKKRQILGLSEKGVGATVERGKAVCRKGPSSSY